MSNHKVEAIERNGLFQVLAACYLQLPDKEKTKQVINVLREAQEVFVDIDFSSLILQVENRWNQLEENSLFIEDLKQEYYDHLLVPITTNYIPPYESAVRGACKIAESKKKNHGGWKYDKLWGICTHNVALCYDAVDFEPSQMNMMTAWKEKNIPDHIGFELAFMAYLCEAEDEANKDSNFEIVQRWYNLQTQFLLEHLKNFSEDYHKIAIEKANPFYLSLIETVVAYVNWDLVQRRN